MRTAAAFAAALLLLAGCAAPNADKLIAEGIANFQVGRIDDADAKLTKALHADPADADALFYMGRVHHARRFYEQAIYYYQCCIDVAPGYPGARKHLDRAQAQAGLMGKMLRFIP